MFYGLHVHVFTYSFYTRRRAYIKILGKIKIYSPQILATQWRRVRREPPGDRNPRAATVVLHLFVLFSTPVNYIEETNVDAGEQTILPSRLRQLCVLSQYHMVACDIDEQPSTSGQHQHACAK